MPEDVRLKITCDTNLIVSLTKFAERTLQALHRLVKLRGLPIDLPELPSGLARVYQDPRAARARKAHVIFYPSDAFLRYTATLLARKFDLDAVKDTSHG